MNIEELKNKEITPLISYIIGMCYPLYREIQIRDQKYIVGGVNHNPNRINETLLASHFKEILTLISDESEKILLMSNQNSECNISSKKGFSILIDVTGYTRNDVEKELFNKTTEISKMFDLSILKWFVLGCFDGRSSWDTTLKCLSVDVDRDYKKQDFIKKIINKFSIEVNLNRRDFEHKKNDQIRIKKESIHLFMSNIGFLSLARKDIVEYAMKNSWSTYGFNLR